ncbi:hypothetical protein ACFY15_00535 [Streptomyces sp. NPDC001373]|uniref:hypothetical protein n=1 Tax=Streptomyces sp. NPDC001373 TaxID=3364565 RepID=UPI0036A03883
MQPCHWYDDGHGGRYLVPGCATRAHDPDGETCTCPTLADQLAKARSEIAALRKAKKSFDHWHTAILVAVHAHPDGVQIMKSAAAQAGV